MHSSRAIAAQNVPIPDTTPEEQFDLFGPAPNPGTAPAASGTAASPNPFVSEAPASPTALQPVVHLLVVCRQVEVPVAVVRLEKETRLLSLLVCCDSHCNRTSR